MHGGNLWAGWAAVGSQIAAVELDWGLEEWGPGERERNFECQNCGKFRTYLGQAESGLEYAKNQVSRSQPIEDMRSHVRGDGHSAEKQARTRGCRMDSYIRVQGGRDRAVRRGSLVPVAELVSAGVFGRIMSGTQPPCGRGQILVWQKG